MDKLLEQLDSRTLRLLALGVILVLASMLFSYAVMPQYKQWQKQRQSVSVLESVQSGQVNIQIQMDVLREEIAEIRRKMRGDLPDMPLQQLESYIIGRLQAVSWRSNVDLLSVRPGLNQTLRRFEEISFDVELSGDYFALYEWLWALGQELGFVVVKNFDITPASHGAVTPMLNARLNVVFYQPESAQ